MGEDRSLNVFWNEVPIARLFERNSIWALQYESAWLTDVRRFPISPALPLQAEEHLDGASIRPVQWFFDNLLPEEMARKLIARDAKIEEEDAFSLLRHFGAESAGSLTLLPESQQPQVQGGLKLLDNQTLSEWIRALPAVSLASRTTKRMSLAGAQHKMAINLVGDQLYQPDANQPSTHILKPEHPDKENYPHSVINEWFVMTLAKCVGLPVPEVILRFVPEAVYIIDRFDRTQANGHPVRLHALDGCQLLGLDRGAKYRQCTLDQLGNIANACLTPIPARIEMFKWLLFNLMVANDDAHLKNVSVLAQSRRYTLAPFYDLLSTAIYAGHGRAWADRGLPTAWSDKQTYADIQSRDDLKALGVEFGIPFGLASKTVEQFIARFEEAIPVAWQMLLDRFALGDVPALYKEGSKRQVRTILYLPINEMLKKVGSELSISDVINSLYPKQSFHPV